MSKLEELVEDAGGFMQGLKSILSKYWLAILVFLGFGFVGAAILWAMSKKGETKK